VPALLRVFLAVALLLVSLPGVVYLSFILSLISVLPRDTSLALGELVASVPAVLAVSFTAPPSHRRKFAFLTGALLTAVQCLAVWFLQYSFSGTLVPVAGVVALTLWIARIRRPALVCTALCPVLLAACYLDCPAWPDRDLKNFLRGTEALRAGDLRFHSYSLSQFIDSEWLWRIDARPEVLETIASERGMLPSDTVPARFWRMPPYYWPRSLPAGARLYSTPSFPAAGRGRDGDHFFMLIDTRRDRGFVWFKNNF